MNKHLLTPRFLTTTLLILGIAVFRLFPHYPNFTPVAGMALFGGAYFSNKKTALIIPFVAMILSDTLLGFHSTIWAVYLSFALIVMIGYLLQTRKRVFNILLASIASSVLFFAITNFSVWVSGEIYPMNYFGLIECYIAAIPFFHYTMLGDLFYAGILFGAFELMQIKFPILAEPSIFVWKRAI